MFTREDLTRFLADMEKLETQMADIYQAVLKEIEDDGLRAIFKRMLAEEMVHAKNLKELGEMGRSG